MNKIKYDLIHRIYNDTSLTNDELNMIIYLAKNADDFGCVEGMYYKECAKELSVCHSQFYNVLNSLQKKGYIQKNKEYNSDINVYLYGNEFIEPDDNCEPVAVYKNYLNLNMAIFEDKEFYGLKVNAKKLLIALLVKSVNDKARRQKNGKHMVKTYLKIFHVPANQYSIYAEKLHVTKRMIKRYFKDIKKWLSTYNDSIYTEKDIITIQECAAKKPEVLVSERGKTVCRKKTDRFDSDLTYVKMLCRRNEVESDNVSLLDAAQLISQYENKAREIGQNIRSIMERAVKAVGGILNAAGLNKHISNYIANASGSILKKTLTTL